MNYQLSSFKLSWPNNTFTRAGLYLSEVLEDVVDDDLLRLVGVHSGERVHVDDSVLKANQRKAQGAFQNLQNRKEQSDIKW